MPDEKEPNARPPNILTTSAGARCTHCMNNTFKVRIEVPSPMKVRHVAPPIKGGYRMVMLECCACGEEYPVDRTNCSI